MEIWKERFSALQREIMRFLFLWAGKSFNQRQLAIKLGVSSTAIAKSIIGLKKENLIIAVKDKETGRIELTLNRDNTSITYLKRIENLKFLHESELLDFLIEKFGLDTIILFGSYSRGEDIFSSDIDIAIIGVGEKDLNLNKFEDMLKRKISLHYFNNIKGISKNLKNGILSGIILHGGIDI